MANFNTNNILYSYNKMHVYFKEIMKTPRGSKQKVWNVNHYTMKPD